MASGKNHDKGIFFTAPVFFVVVIGTTQNIILAFITTIFFYFSGLFLSPDLDCPSRPYYRWGLLKYIWLPYQLIPHRGVSHWLFIGSLTRLLYLGGIFAGISIGADSLSTIYNFDIIWWFQMAWKLPPLRETIVYWGAWLYAACESTAIVHYILDNLWGFLPKSVYDKLKK